MAKVQSRFQQKRVPKFKSISEIDTFFLDLNKQIDASYSALAYAINNATPVTLTANLPAGSTEMDGQILIEEAAGPTLNLIIYGAGIRARINGAVF